MQTRSYEDKSGVKRYITECVADQVQILSPKSEGAAQTQEPEMTPVNDDDDLPF
nr:MAG TPA: Single strand binding protein [Caudoviricetes sp.]